MKATMKCGNLQASIRITLWTPLAAYALIRWKELPPVTESKCLMLALAAAFGANVPSNYTLSATSVLMGEAFGSNERERHSLTSQLKYLLLFGPEKEWCRLFHDWMFFLVIRLVWMWRFVRLSKTSIARKHEERGLKYAHKWAKSFWQAVMIMVHFFSHITSTTQNAMLCSVCSESQKYSILCSAAHDWLSVWRWKKWRKMQRAANKSRWMNIRGGILMFALALYFAHFKCVLAAGKQYYISERAMDATTALTSEKTNDVECLVRTPKRRFFFLRNFRSGFFSLLIFDCYESMSCDEKTDVSIEHQAIYRYIFRSVIKQTNVFCSRLAPIQRGDSGYKS